MTHFNIFYEITNLLRHVTLCELNKLNYYYNSEFQIVLFQGKEINIFKSFKDYNMMDNDLIVIRQKNNMEINQISKVFISGQYLQNKFKILIDCTLKENIVSTNIAKKMNMQNDNIISRVFNFEGIDILVDLHIYDTQNDLIIFGSNFLNSNNAILYFRKRQLRIGTQYIKFFNCEYYHVSEIFDKFQEMIFKIDMGLRYDIVCEINTICKEILGFEKKKSDYKYFAEYECYVKFMKKCGFVYLLGKDIVVFKGDYDILRELLEILFDIFK